MIRQIRSKFGNAEVLRASFNFAILSGFRLLSNLIIGKFTAQFLGASGLYFVGQFQSLVLFGQNIATGATHNGIIASWSAKEKDPAELVSGYSGISLLFSLVAGIFLTLFPGLISGLLFNAHQFTLPIRILGAGLVFTGFTQVFIAILNGEKSFREVSVANNLLSLATTVSIITGTLHSGIEGALTGLALSQVPAAFFIFILLRKRASAIFLPLKIHWDTQLFRKLIPYSLMSLVSVSAVVLVQTAVREEISVTLSEQAAGYWEGAFRFGNLYTFFISFLFTGYFLPLFSKRDAILSKEIGKGFGFFTGLFLLIFLCYLPLKGTIFPLIFSKDFCVLENLIPLFILGDFFKACSWLFTNTLVARGKTRHFIFFEILGQIFLWAGCQFALPLSGFEGLFYAYASVWGLHLLLMFFYFIPVLFLSKKL